MKIFCVGRNYAAHAKEMNSDVPEEPIIFMKPQNALINYTSPFYYPEFTNELHYEAELVLRVCKNGRYIPERFANQYFNAITVGIDFTARDLQNELKDKGLPWEKAKAWDNSALIGDWVNTDNNTFKQPVHFSMKKNEETVQVGDSSMMIFPYNILISNISKYFSLNIGDLIFTGTPAGVGECVAGDVLEGFLEERKVFEMKIR
jgi:2-keto-4-pentenoate hydratase/2-oxohepta-3-ene-1,7-dioic acid hydratase in catechol pathway